MYMQKKVAERGHPCLTPILQLICFDHRLVFLNLEITFSYNLIAVYLNLKGTFVSSNLLQKKNIGFIIMAFMRNDPKYNEVVCG